MHFIQSFDIAKKFSAFLKWAKWKSYIEKSQMLLEQTKVSYCQIRELLVNIFYCYSSFLIEKRTKVLAKPKITKRILGNRRVYLFFSSFIMNHFGNFFVVTKYQC